MTLQERWTQDKDRFHFDVPEGWRQGRSVFGGLTVALGAALGARLSSRRLRTVQAQLLGPVSAGRLTGTARVLREGKTTTFVHVELSQESSLRAQVSLVFIQGRERSIRIEGPVAPEWAEPTTLPKMPYIAGITPEFTDKADFYFAEGTLPFQGGPDARLGGYIRFKDTAGASPAELQLMLLDAWPCPSILRLSAPAFASTVTWTAHLLGDSAPGFHRFRDETLAGNDGFSTTLGHMWDSKGKHVAVTEQTAVIFD
ncbi:MAG: acyl-CoA thioesterase [Polyangiales bacterium]|jgi:acyl-CoA thioesterase